MNVQSFQYTKLKARLYQKIINWYAYTHKHTIHLLQVILDKRLYCDNVQATVSPTSG